MSEQNGGRPLDEVNQNIKQPTTGIELCGHTLDSATADTLTLALSYGIQELADQNKIQLAKQAQETWNLAIDRSETDSHEEDSESESASEIEIDSVRQTLNQRNHSASRNLFHALECLNDMPDEDIAYQLCVAGRELFGGTATVSIEGYESSPNLLGWEPPSVSEWETRPIDTEGALELLDDLGDNVLVVEDTRSGPRIEMKIRGGPAWFHKTCYDHDKEKEWTERMERRFIQNAVQELTVKELRKPTDTDA